VRPISVRLILYTLYGFTRFAVKSATGLHDVSILNPPPRGGQC
jgi:hypothetical protein